ncbi:hypothetical protein NT01EI_3050 [Edwardsiella ictaluri 93-146]|uniref:Uncharacterized protein n=1 Tax=Edwardsiella ictaluri (strain 93-146) TaxID=634503 RepID=C5BAJ5_EDWI9|nr:hypothetical protein NT01EI_3050 [Edwardsiella ictaluri 93-146]
MFSDNLNQNGNLPYMVNIADLASHFHPVRSASSFLMTGGQITTADFSA